MACTPNKACLAVTLFSSCLTVLLVSHTAIAGSKPDITRPVEKAVIEKMFKGNSWRWRYKWTYGGAYHSPDGKMIGKWFAKGNRHGKSLDVIGHGRWNVSKIGTLCHNAEWRWRRDGKLVNRNVKDCWRHVIDEKGNLWQHDQRHGWYRFPKHNIFSGDRFSKRYNRISRKNKLWGE